MKEKSMPSIEQTRAESLQEIVHRCEAIRDSARKANAFHTLELAEQMVSLTQMLLNDTIIVNTGEQ